MKHYIEEASIIICNLIEGYLSHETLLQKSNKLKFMINGFRLEISPEAKEIDNLFQWYIDNDGLEEVRALIFIICEISDNDSDFIDFIFQALLSTTKSFRLMILEALKWTVNKEIDGLLPEAGNTKDEELYQAITGLIRFRSQTCYPVTIPFYQSN